MSNDASMMAETGLTAPAARQRLYEIMRGTAAFEQKARAALELGVEFLGVETGHLARIDPQTDHWEAVVSTATPDGACSPKRDLTQTYCRQTIRADAPLSLHDASAQGWADDPAFETHGLSCYHGTTVVLDGEPYGTVTFVAQDPRDTPFSDRETMFAELVTRLLERELERQQHETELDRRSNLVNVLNRVLRHNLRNDMCVIRGHTELLAAEHENDSYVETVLGKIDDVIELSEKAHELERVVGQDHDGSSTDIVALVTRVVEAVRSAYPAASITLDCDGEITATVMPSFRRAVYELVENAAKHGGESPTVRVSVETVPNAVEVHVTDDGPGLAETERKVLETGVETPLEHGSGLGLWLVYWTATSHDGTVEATVTEDGTAMTVTVPRTPTTDAHEQTATRRQVRDRYKAAFEEAADPMLICNTDARIVNVNRAAASTCGRRKQALLGCSLRDLFADEQDVETVRDAFREADTRRGTATLVDDGGTTHDVRFVATAGILPEQHLLVFRDAAGA